MKFIISWRSAGLTAMVILACGCASNRLAPTVVDERPFTSQGAQPQQDRTRSSESTKSGVAANENAPGIVVHIDPITGEFRPGPPGGATLPQAAQAAKAAAPPFKEIPSPIPGGGVMIDVQGHFHTPLVATMDADGKVTLKHESTMPPGAEK